MITANRRWFRYSLRTLFVMMTLFCLWLGYYGRWAYLRRTARDWIDAHRYVPPVAAPLGATSFTLALTEPPGIPWPLRMFGEEAASEIEIERKNDEPAEYLRQLEKLKGLFPEAEVVDMSPRDQ